MRQLKISRAITNRSEEAVEKYLSEIGRIPLISPEEEVALAIKIKKGDQQALDKLVEANLRFAVSVAKQHQNQGFSLSDLINEGNLGLIKAAQRFDETKGFKFVSYAVWWIRQSIKQAIADQGRLVRLPQNKGHIGSRAEKAHAAFEQEHERNPTTEELAELIEEKENILEEILATKTRHTSFDAPINDEETASMCDITPDTTTPEPDAIVMQDSLRDAIRYTLKKMRSHDAEVITAWLELDGEEGMNKEKYAEKYDITEERVRQIYGGAILRLRNASYGQNLRAYLG